MLQASVGHELLAGRQAARDEGRAGLEAELDRVFPLSVSTAELDAAASFIAASSITAAWGAAALAALAADKSPSKAARSVDPNVQRSVATEVASAFNGERDRLLIDLGEMGGIDGAGGGRLDTRTPGMYKVWSAVLDRVTCARCFGADGEVVELHKEFKGGFPPPLHPNCRCVVEHVIVPKPERIDDISIDYDLFKAELRDVIREGRVKVDAAGQGDRHSLGFVSDSLGAGRNRSPKALTKRLANEDYATRR